MRRYGRLLAITLTILPACAGEAPAARAPTAVVPPAPTCVELPRSEASRRAAQLAKEGDQEVKVNVEGAIQRYEAALALLDEEQQNPQPLPPGVIPCPARDAAYTPKPAPTGRSPALPAIPALPQRTIKEEEAYTIQGAVHHLRSRVHAAEVNGRQIALIGYIVAVNYADAPACAVHRRGKADRPGCVAPLPTFTLADGPDGAGPRVDVMGWASNFAQLYDLIEAIDKAPAGKAGAVALDDEFWGTPLPNPLPNLGARVKVKGTYGVAFTRATAGMAVNPKFGIMTADQIDYLIPPPEKAYLPGMKPKNAAR